MKTPCRNQQLTVSEAYGNSGGGKPMLEEIKNIMRKLVLTAGDSKTGAGGTFTFFFSFFFILAAFCFPPTRLSESSCSFSASRRLLNVDALPLVLGTYK